MSRHKKTRWDAMTDIKALELAYVRIQVPDLDEAERFFTAFGLPTQVKTADRLYARGTGPDHHLIVAHRGEQRLLATAYELRSEADLERASRLPDASAIQPIDGPGGGWRVMLTDLDGNGVELVHGITKIEPIEVPKQEFNFAAVRDRRRNAVIRPHKGPSHVLRIGHVVIRSPDVAALSAWYQRVLGLLESDDVPAPDGDGLLMSFVRLDQGETPVDHHVMQILKAGKNRIHHLSFEVQDIDDLYVGHEAMREAGFRHMWGIGRHVQGSQIFDYWIDPFGVMYEHWTDSDRLDATVAKGVTPLDEMHAPWGPEMPPDFIAQGSL
jgi:catechol 2,3-dioxygenase-like lactoylglutathione lyase family enzyme